MLHLTSYSFWCLGYNFGLQWVASTVNFHYCWHPCNYKLYVHNIYVLNNTWGQYIIRRTDLLWKQLSQKTLFWIQGMSFANNLDWRVLEEREIQAKRQKWRSIIVESMTFCLNVERYCSVPAKCWNCATWTKNASVCL